MPLYSCIQSVRLEVFTSIVQLNGVGHTMGKSWKCLAGLEFPTATQQFVNVQFSLKSDHLETENLSAPKLKLS